MSIKFHCEHCGREIKAPDNSGGSKGKCPGCRQMIYVPTPDIDELALAPVDEEEEERMREKIARELAAEHDLLAEKRGDSPAADDDAPMTEADLDGPGDGGIALPSTDPAPSTDPKTLVIAWLKHMASGDLTKAASVLSAMKADKQHALDAIGLLASDAGSTPELKELPPPVRNGFLKQLTHELK